MVTESTPRVTVLMSVYNGLPYLEQAIESILRQTFRNFEFLIIDDGSTDGSREVLEQWANRDKRVRLIFHEKNRGLGYALKEGVEAARSPWIARMDDDDISFPNRLEEQVSYIEKHPEVDILGAWAIDVDEQGREMQSREYPTTHKEIVSIIWTNPLIHPTVMMRKAAIKRVGSYDPAVRKRQDYELWFRCVDGGLKFANIPKVLLKYRFTGDYYRRNDLSVAWDQARMGWKGCWKIAAGPMAYLGVGVPLFRSLLPRRLNAGLHRLLHYVDPRQQSK